MRRAWPNPGGVDRNWAEVWKRAHESALDRVKRQSCRHVWGSRAGPTTQVYAVLSKTIPNWREDEHFPTIIFVIEKCGVKKRVPTGRFVDIWEPDHEKKAGVSKSEWDRMSMIERANVELVLQSMWAEATFYQNYLSYYMQDAFQKLDAEAERRYPKDGASHLRVMEYVSREFLRQSGIIKG